MRSSRGVPCVTIAILLFATAARAEAGDRLIQRVAEMETGRLVLAFAARPGVYGDGRSIITHAEEDGDGQERGGCDEGPVRLSASVRNGSVRRLKVRVGGVERQVGESDVQMGQIPVAEATGFLLDLARTAPGPVAEDALFAATLADSVVVWPDLLAIARDEDRPPRVREAAVFWLGQAAGDAAAQGLQSVVDDAGADLELREHAVFALSQRPSRESVPALAEIARGHRHPELRRTALFWLAQHDDPRVLDLFEEILRGE